MTVMGKNMNHGHAIEKQVRIGRISYMNVAPIYFGLDKQNSADWYDILSAPPAVLNHKMAIGELDISPVSTAAYAEHQKDWLLLPGLSISCDGPVMSVLLASRYSLKELGGKSVVISDESASAAALLRLIFMENDIEPVISRRKIDPHSSSLPDADAVLVIGDTALNGKWRKSYKYVWDLCGEWKDSTGLPFVFALWAVRREFAQKHADRVTTTLQILNQSRRQGCANIPTIATSLQTCCKLDSDILKRYFHGLQYDLDKNKLKGLQEFYLKLYQSRLIPAPVALRFFEPMSQDKMFCRGRKTDGTPSTMMAPEESSPH